jgi:hypothetical protein
MANFECRVVERVVINESEFEHQICGQMQNWFSRGWILASLLPDPSGGSETYRAILYKITDT